RFVLVGKILRRRAECCKRIDHAVRANRGVAADIDVREQPGAIADLRVRPDHAARADLHVAANLGFRIDEGGGVNAHGRWALMAANSHSAHSSPRTSTWPWNLKMLRRANSTFTGISITSPGSTGFLKRALSTDMKRMRCFEISASSVLDMRSAPV